LGIVLEVTQGEPLWVRRMAVLAGYAESDYRPRKAATDETFGVYQQNPRWWPSALQGTASQCRAFVADAKANEFRKSDDLVLRCWWTQRWSIPGSNYPNPGPNFEAEKVRRLSQTENYARRVPLIDQIIRDRRLP
jgi:hypothetical protein